MNNSEFVFFHFLFLFLSLPNPAASRMIWIVVKWKLITMLQWLHELVQIIALDNHILDREIPSYNRHNNPPSLCQSDINHLYQPKTSHHKCLL